MDTIRINPLIVSVDPTAETMISPIAPTHHGGVIKKIIPVVAAILIPIAAPAITSAVAASGVLGATVSGAISSSAVAATAASAVTGAALGAVTAKVTGQDVKAGAIGGALGGGIGGYATAAGTPGAGIPAVTASEQISNISNLSMPLSSATPETTGLQVGSNEAVVTTPTGESVVVPASTTGVDAVADSTAANLSNQVSGTGASGGGGAGAGAGAGVGAGTEVVKQTALQTAASNLSKVPSLVLSKVTDPATIASLTLQAGAMLAGTAMVPETEMSPELVETLENYKNELATLKANNEAAFNEKMAAAREFMNQANYYDPEYFAQQAAANAAIAEGRKLQEFQRAAGLQYGGLSAGELRRAALAGGQRVQSAYDQGFQTAVGLRDKTLTTGVGLIPAGDTTMANAYANLANMQLGQFAQDKADDDAKRANISAFFNKLNLTSGLSNEDQEDLDEEKDSFNTAVLGTNNNQQGGLKLGTIT